MQCIELKVLVKVVEKIEEFFEIESILSIRSIRVEIGVMKTMG